MQSGSFPSLSESIEHCSPDVLAGMYEMMLRIRRVEERIADVYGEQEMRCPVHLSIGQEAVAVGVSAALRRDDYVFSTHRCHAHYLAKGGNLRRMIAELYGKRTGCCQGKGGSMHLSDVSVGMMGTSAVVGGSIPLAAGAALSFAMRATGQVAVAFFGDAALEQGVFHESLSFAALRRLPVLFVCENNFYATHAHLAKRQPLDNISERGGIYGVPGDRVDGNDVLAVYLSALHAVGRCRSGEGPALMECRTYRWSGHVAPGNDHEIGYRTVEEVESWMANCPLTRWRRWLLESDAVGEDQLSLAEARVQLEIEQAFLQGRADPFPTEAELLTDVY